MGESRELIGGRRGGFSVWMMGEGCADVSVRLRFS